MKQLVSVVENGMVCYYTAEGEEVEEFARIKVGDGFAPMGIVGLGLNLSSALGLDAPTRKKPAPVVIEATTPAAVPAIEKGKGGKPKQQRRKPADRKSRTDFTHDMVWDALAKFPAGAGVGELATAMGMTSDLDRKTVNNRLISLLTKDRITRVTIPRSGGSNGRHRSTFLYEVVRPVPVSEGGTVHQHPSGVPATALPFLVAAQ